MLALQKTPLKKLWNERKYLQHTYQTKILYLEYINNSYNSIVQG